jgi:hypothetical protein
MTTLLQNIVHEKSPRVEAVGRELARYGLVVVVGWIDLIKFTGYGDFDDAKQGREASDAHEPVDPAHQRTVGDERTDPLGLVSRELHEADPPHHDHQAIASQRAADRLRLET